MSRLQKCNGLCCLCGSIDQCKSKINQRSEDFPAPRANRFPSTQLFPICAIFHLCCRAFPCATFRLLGIFHPPRWPTELGHCNLPIGTGDLVKVILRIFNLPKLSFRRRFSPESSVLPAADFGCFCSLSAFRLLIRRH